ncbi:MAG: sodium-dependent transporter [bacterium]
MESSTKNRGQWSSKFGFVVSAAGSAVGLANIWAFPFRTGQNGGAAFVLIYLASTFLICLPFMFVEITLGRYSQKNVVGAIRAIQPKRVWIGLGILSLTASIFILSFYSVVAGWSVGYIFKMLVGENSLLPVFAAKPEFVIPLFLLFLIFTILVVQGGVKHGIERWSRVLMPFLIVLMLILIIRSLTFPGARTGLEFYLKPDFSKINGHVVMTAMGQAFFSLSLGIGGLLTYGSYLSKRDNIITSSVYIALFDVVIALLAGFMIFPALFAFGQPPNEGPALVFIILPKIFTQLPFGNIFGASFFVMLTIAALTSTISMLEISVAYFVDERGWPRRHIVWLLGAVAFLLGLPSALSQGAVPYLSQLPFFGGKSYLELMIFLWFDVFPPVGAVLFSLFVAWVWGIDKAATELKNGCPFFDKKLPGLPFRNDQIWGFFIRYVCPVVIALVLLTAI